MHPIVASGRHEVAALCRGRGVKRLDLFGSATRDDVDEARSDLDFLVEFAGVPQGHSLEAYFGLKDALEAMLANSGPGLRRFYPQPVCSGDHRTGSATRFLGMKRGPLSCTPP